MLSLKNTQNNLSIKLDVLGYQIETTNGSEDDDWVNIQVEINHDGNSFKKVDPSLLAGELSVIYWWFLSLSERSIPDESIFSTFDGCLLFSFIQSYDDKILISITFDGELEPDFEINQVHPLYQRGGLYLETPGIHPYGTEIIFELQKDDYPAILGGLKETAKKYPKRSSQPSALDDL